MAYKDEDVRTAEVVGWFWDADQELKAGRAKTTASEEEQHDRKRAKKIEPDVLETYLQLALKKQKRLNEYESLAIARSLGSRHIHLIAFSAAIGRVWHRHSTHRCPIHLSHRMAVDVHGGAGRLGACAVQPAPDRR